MSLPFKNLYHSRKVAESASKACFICYKPTPSVFVSSDGKADYFYVCDTHLNDSSFAASEVDPEVEAAKARKMNLSTEIKELEQKLKTKEEKEEKEKEEKSKSKDKDDKKDKDEDRDEDDQRSKKSGKLWQKDVLDSLLKQQKTDEELLNRKPRVFILNKDIYRIRIQNYREAQRSKQTKQMLSNPSLFPKVPTHAPAGNTTGNER